MSLMPLFLLQAATLVIELIESIQAGHGRGFSTSRL